MRFIAFLATTLTVVSAMRLHTRQDGSGIIDSCVQTGQVALTFDDGPWQYNRELVDKLVAAGIRATFFVNGDNFNCIYNKTAVADLRYALDKNMEIQAHSWSHPDMTTLSSQDMANEFDWLTEALQKALGICPSLFRPPYGACNDAVLAAAAQRGMQVFTWDVDTGDADGASVEDSENTIDDTPWNTPGSAIVLSHETLQTTVEQLVDYMINTLIIEYGYIPVTASECAGLSTPYTCQGSPGKVDATWFCPKKVSGPSS
ncbi:hypothetical protein C8F01DRAFT_1176396 [Mycena amicta]|nr:hypothetical protein C8F01DRAFT_1176396 [Mycena amicta]